MNVDDAIKLMAKNPAVDFPWEGVVIELVNSFLPGDAKLDPQVVTADALREVIERFDSVTKQMIYSTNLATAGSVGPVVSETRNRGDGRLGVNRHFAIFMMFGMTVCACAILVALKVGDGVKAEYVIEMVKLIASLMTSVLESP